MTLGARLVPRCPFAGCPMRPFKQVKTGHGWTISLCGCRFCNFNYVVALASDNTGRTRPVAQWSFGTASGLYVLAKEYGTHPPEWIDLTCAALPRPRQPEPIKPDGTRSET